MSRRSAAAAAVFLLAAGLAAAQENGSPSLADALTNGEAGLDLRYRYEHVNQDGFGENANASTLRLRLNYQTGSWLNWSGFAEFDYIGELLFRDFNSLGGSSPNRDQYPVVADPKGPDLNQLYIDFKPQDDTRLRLGRQRIVLDNQRFVGDVGWRQNTQTYDAFGITYGGITRTEMFYSYIGAVRTILGNDVAAGRQDSDTHLLHANLSLSSAWQLAPYYYLIDNNDVAAFSSATLGVRATGTVDLGNGTLLVTGELATQSDAGNNPVNYDAEYVHLGVNWTPHTDSALSIGIDYESLGGDQNQVGAAFRTPLATLHAFQGWADKFLATPGEGVNDLFLTVKYKVGAWNLTGVYHDFSAEAGSLDWGTELDLSAGRKLGDRYGVLFKTAFYDADAHATDTNKFWIMLTAAY